MKLFGKKGESMDIATILGFIVVCVLLVVGMGLNVGPFIDVPSMAIVIGGTMGSVIMAYPMGYFFKSIYIIKKTVFNRQADLKEIINLLVFFAEKARREGMLTLESEIEKIDDDFLRKGVQLIVDGMDPLLVKNIMEDEIAVMEERHNMGKGVLENAASLAPAYGMLGTLIGLILMLGSLNDPGSMGPAMATALITTLYGSFMANAIFTPMAIKLSNCNKKEVLEKNLITEGILSIQAGENPKSVEEKLKTFLSPAERAEMGGKGAE